jgi:hypothetical protein
MCFSLSESRMNMRESQRYGRCASSEREICFEDSETDRQFLKMLIFFSELNWTPRPGSALLTTTRLGKCWTLSMSDLLLHGAKSTRQLRAHPTSFNDFNSQQNRPSHPILFLNFMNLVELVRNRESGIEAGAISSKQIAGP